MSEFQIIKCKSCDAPLVELQGQKIQICQQCGYNFLHKVNKKSKLEAVVEQAFEQLQDNKQATPKRPIVRQSKVASNTPTPVIDFNTQKIFAVIGKVLKWYVVFFFLIILLRTIF